MGVVVKHGTYAQYSGPYVVGNKDSRSVAPPRLEAPFLTKAFWLLIMAECQGRFGVINMRDGTGVTAGLHQAVACYPQNPEAQGELFKYLWRVTQAVNLEETRLGSLLAGETWFVGPGGLTDGSSRPVTGSQFRAVVTPPAGRTPKQGLEWRTSRAWAVAFHELFSMPELDRLQMQYGVEVLYKKICRFRARKYLDGQTLESVAFRGNAKDSSPFWHVEAELAHALMLSFAINAPAWAFQVYNSVMKRRKSWRDHSELDTPEFARALIQGLADKAHKWDDDVRGSRYQRSRTAAQHIWPADLFQDGGVMAEDLPG